MLICRRISEELCDFVSHVFGLDTGTCLEAHTLLRRQCATGGCMSDTPDMCQTLVLACHFSNFYNFTAGSNFNTSAMLVSISGVFISCDWVNNIVSVNWIYLKDTLNTKLYHRNGCRFKLLKDCLYRKVYPLRRLSVE